MRSSWATELARDDVLAADDGAGVTPFSTTVICGVAGTSAAWADVAPAPPAGPGSAEAPPAGSAEAPPPPPQAEALAAPAAAADTIHVTFGMSITAMATIILFT